MSSQFTIIDLFCGTGGFATGFLNSSRKYKLVYAIDNDEKAAATACANHSSTIIETADIRGVDLSHLKVKLNLNAVDVIIGGPPCQGFSSLRPNRSSNNEDERNNLFLRFAAFVKAFRPRLFVLENVVGLITHNNGDTLSRIHDAFDSLGYSLDWRILNAASFGVPQKRERFIMIGSLDHGPVSFPRPTHSFNGRVIGHHDRSRCLLGPDSLPSALTVNEAIDDLPELQRGEEAIAYDKSPRTPFQRARRSRCTRLTLHRASKHSDKMMEVIRHAGANSSCIPKHLITSGFSSCYSRLDANEPSTTITVKFQSPASSKCIHPTQDRTLTPREAARIQSFDDSYVFRGSLTQIAAQLGNAVPPLLGRAIGSHLLKVLG